MNIDNRLTLKVLGSGTCVPRVERSSPSYLVKYQNKKFLMDCGAGAIRQLVRTKEDYRCLTGVILSHFHPDHCSDLIPLIQALSYTPNFERKEKLIIIGAVGLKSFVESLLQIYKLLPLSFEIQYIELENDFFEFENKFKIESIKGNHSEESIIVKITYRDETGFKRGFVYSGDTDFTPEISDFATGINLLVLECSFPDKRGKHLTPEEAGRIASLARPDKLMLTHFYPPVDNPEIKLLHRVKEFFIGQTLLAQDFTEIII